MEDSSTKPKRASGRTPEQQAARDARKAAKKALASSTSPADIDHDVQLHLGQTASSSEFQPPPQPSSLKRSWDETQDKDAIADEKPLAAEQDLLEIDPDLPAPLSRAEARAAKKRSKLASQATNVESSETTPSTTVIKTKSAPTPVVKQNSIWIGNLAFKTTSESLKAFLEKGVEELGGEPGSVTRVNLPKPPAQSGRSGYTIQHNRGFAYCDFKTASLRTLAIQLSERPLDGRRVLIKEGDDHQPTPNARTPKPEPVTKMTQKLLSKQPHSETSTLFLGNLPFDATEEELRDLVETNASDLSTLDKETETPIENPSSSRGGIKSGLLKTRVATFQDTGRCKGFAFWDFKSPDQAKAALLNKKNHYLRGKKLVVQFASESATNRSGKSRNANPSSGKERPAHRPFKRATEEVEGQDAREVDVVDVPEAEEAPARDKRGKKWESTGRPRPGAALAMARREQVGIVKSQGAKTTFE